MVLWRRQDASALQKPEFLGETFDLSYTDIALRKRLSSLPEKTKNAVIPSEAGESLFHLLFFRVKPRRDSSLRSE